MSSKVGVLALDKNGKVTICKASPENRGKGRCPHSLHQEEGETDADFIKRAGDLICEEGEEEKPQLEHKPITQNRVLELREKIYEICGTRDVHGSNIKEVLETLPLEKQRQIMEIGFEESKNFSFPITDDNFEEEDIKTKIYFGNMGDFGLGAKQRHIKEILHEIGESVSEKGPIYIKNNYKNGLNDDEWWDLQYATRVASVNKTVSISAPGAEARNLFYGLSDTVFIEDCFNDESTGILTCKAPGGLCEKCAKKSGMDTPSNKGMLSPLQILKNGCPNEGVRGIRIGGFVSTNLSEPLTQSYLNAIHAANDPNANQHKAIVATYECFSRSPIIEAVKKEQTTIGRRKVLFEKLKEAYAVQGINIDDFNIEIVAKKMTSYKKGDKGLRLVEDGELCDIISIKSTGNRGNIFKKASLGSAFKTLSEGGSYKKNADDAFNSLNIQL